jgi:hypothetical protein
MDIRHKYAFMLTKKIIYSSFFPTIRIAAGTQARRVFLPFQLSFQHSVAVPGPDDPVTDTGCVTHGQQTRTDAVAVRQQPLLRIARRITDVVTSVPVGTLEMDQINRHAQVPDVTRRPACASRSK